LVGNIALDQQAISIDYHACSLWVGKILLD